jgi:hypothetical protein
MKSDRICINLNSDSSNFLNIDDLGLIIKKRKLCAFELWGFKDYRQCNKSNLKANQFLSIVTNFGNNVKKLLIADGEFEFNYFISILNAMPNLEELNIDGAILKPEIFGILKPHLDFENLLRYGYVTYDHLNNYLSKQSSICWKKLRKLKCNLFSMECLEILKKSRDVEEIEIDQHPLLIKLGIEQSVYKYPNECLELINERNCKFNVTKFEDFLKLQTNLKILKLHDFRQLHLFTHKKFNFPFKLESIIIKNLTCEECLLQLIESQKDSLKSILILEHSRPFSFELFWKVVEKTSQLKNLRKFELEVYSEESFLNNPSLNFDIFCMENFKINFKIHEKNYNNYVSLVKFGIQFVSF